MKHYIIPIFIPHLGCPNQCVFCNQRLITGASAEVTVEQVRAIIAGHLARISEPRRVEIAFYGGSFTALPAARQIELLAPARQALEDGAVDAIRVSTRPDAVDCQRIERLIEFGVGTIELGAQSLDDAVLASAGRGHSAADTAKAAALIKSYALQCGIQLMPGLPGEDWPSLIRTAGQVVRLRPDFTRVYPTIVIAGTQLAALYQAGRYAPLALDSAVARAAYLKLLFESAGIPVIRTGLQATEDLNADTVLAGPYHPAFGELVESFWYRMLVARLLDCFPAKRPEKLTVVHHRRDASKVRGLNNRNTAYWRSQYGIREISFRPEGTRQGEIIVEIDQIQYNGNKFMLLNN
ncbi:MAG TPA: radical SAM protein [Selenomonadales bacterium]|nr:radical SAM protein [Selenomonadales bacterium]